MVRNLNVANKELKKKKEEFERDGFRVFTLDDHGPVPVHTLSSKAVCVFLLLSLFGLSFFPLSLFCWFIIELFLSLKRWDEKMLDNIFSLQNNLPVNVLGKVMFSI